MLTCSNDKAVIIATEFDILHETVFHKQLTILGTNITW